jgi:hypothetical protein
MCGELEAMSEVKLQELCCSRIVGGYLPCSALSLSAAKLPLSRVGGIAEAHQDVAPLIPTSANMNDDTRRIASPYTTYTTYTTCPI